MFIHCSYSNHADHDDISVIRRWHVEERGWSDVGYHYFIKSDGTIQRGRPLSRIPAAQRGHNDGTIAICLHGRNRGDFTAEQYMSLRRLCGTIADAVTVTVHGHCEVSEKDCPVFDYAAVLALDAEGRMNLGG